MPTLRDASVPLAVSILPEAMASAGAEVEFPIVMLLSAWVAGDKVMFCVELPIKLTVEVVPEFIPP